MNPVHTAIVRRVRETITLEGKKKKLSSALALLTDEQVARMMFSNFRGKGNETRGMRLTSGGLKMMLSCFQHVEVILPKARKLQAGELVYLDRRAKLPYYCTDEKLVVFETELGMKIKLYGGDINAIIAVESY
jgi:hypothetical protein